MRAVSAKCRANVALGHLRNAALFHESYFPNDFRFRVHHNYINNILNRSDPNDLQSPSAHRVDPEGPRHEIHKLEFQHRDYASKIRKLTL